MGYKSKVFGLRKIDLDEGYWVEVAPLTKAEDDATKLALIGGRAPEGQLGVAGISARFHQREYTDQVLLAAIKRWNLDDDGGALLPISLEQVQGLSNAHSDVILAAVLKITNPLQDQAARRD